MADREVFNNSNWGENLGLWRSANQVAERLSRARSDATDGWIRAKAGIFPGDRVTAVFVNGDEHKGVVTYTGIEEQVISIREDDDYLKYIHITPDDMWMIKSLTVQIKDKVK